MCVYVEGGRECQRCPLFSSAQIYRELGTHKKGYLFMAMYSMYSMSSNVQVYAHYSSKLYVGELEVQWCNWLCPDMEIAIKPVLMANSCFPVSGNF